MKNCQVLERNMSSKKKYEGTCSHLEYNGINDHLFSPLHNMFVGKCWNGQKVVDYLLEPLQFSSLSRNKKNQDERDWVYCRVFFFFPWVHDNGDSWNGRDTVKPKWLLSLTRYRPAKMIWAFSRLISSS